MSAYIQMALEAKHELESLGSSVNLLELEGVQVIAWIERWRGEPYGGKTDGEWAPVDATATFADGMQAGKTVRMNLYLLLADTMPDLEGVPHWVAFAQALSSKFSPIVMEIEEQSKRLSISYEQLLYEGTHPQISLYCEKLAYFAALVLPAIARLRLEAWTLDDARNLAQLVLNEALSLGYQQ